MPPHTIHETLITVPNIAVGLDPCRTYSKTDVLYALELGKVEDSSLTEGNYLHEGEAGWTNGFLDMLQTAFFQHKPIVLTPDHLWLLICQGFAEHLKQNASFFRKRLVNHSGQMTIQVHIPDFVKGQPNPWEEIFPQFEQEIKAQLNEDLHSLLVQNFSTTTIKERTAFQIAFLDAVSKYFKYEALTLCGIPKIKLLGTVADYEKMKTALLELGSFKLDWWTTPLMRILDQIIQSIQGKVDTDFWKSIYHFESGSGRPDEVSGWISHFFPYVRNKKPRLFKKDWIKNPHLFGKDTVLEPTDFPSGITKVPFIWDYLGQQFDMHFVSGFIGTTECPNSHFLTAHINWIVTEDTA